MNMHAIAQQNLKNLANTPYPGRGFVIGLNASGSHFAQPYWVTVRSPDYQNRFALDEGEGSIRVVMADPNKVPKSINTANLIYRAMAERRDLFIVSNGKQTEAVFDDLAATSEISLQRALMNEEYEEDPLFTPRITGTICRYGGPQAEIVVLKQNAFNGSCDRPHFPYEELTPGFGYGVTTYTGSGDSLRSFEGEPIIFPLGETAEEIAQEYWDCLNPDYRVLMAVKMIPVNGDSSSTHLINTRELVPAN